MDTKQLFTIATKALKTNKTRSILTMLGVIIGVMSVILLVSLGSGLQKYITDQLEGLGSNLLIITPGKVDLKKMSSGNSSAPPAALGGSKLKFEDIKSLKDNSTYIEAVIPISTTQSVVKYEENKIYIQVSGTTTDFLSVRNASIKVGDFFTESDENTNRKVAVLGSNTVKDLFNSSDPIGEKIQIGDTRLTVIGVLDSKGGSGNMSIDDTIYLPFSTANQIFNRDRVSTILVKASGSETVNQAALEAKNILLGRLTEDDFTILDQKDILGVVASILSMLTLALAGIAAISLLVGGIGIMNIMLVSVTERTKEIGLRKALGATPKVILSQFLMEAVILSMGGGIIGILLGGGISFIMQQFIPMQLTLWSVLISFGVSVSVGLIFGVAPANRASKLSPIEALKYE